MACDGRSRVANVSLQGKGLAGMLSLAVVGMLSLVVARRPSVTGLYVHYNALRGGVPQELANLTQLTNIYLDVNNFSGPIPWRSAPWPPCKGRLHGSDVTTKRLLVSRQQLSECVNEYELFKNEIKILSEIQLANIVKLMGYCVERSERVSVYEYMQNGSLEDVIFGRTRAGLALDWPSHFRIIEGITHGADYLHNHPRIRIIHRDLKLSNILLDSDMNPKISNFDLAEMITSGVDRQKTNCVIGSV